jgi:hypothetical protein
MHALGFLLVTICTPGYAQSVVGGSWKCANDAGNGVIQTLPPANARLATTEQHFAPAGSLFEAALAKGGPSGLFVTGHLHAIHNDRTGHTDYAAATMIRDEGGLLLCGPAETPDYGPWNLR